MAEFEVGGEERGKVVARQLCGVGGVCLLCGDAALFERETREVAGGVDVELVVDRGRRGRWR